MTPVSGGSILELEGGSGRQCLAERELPASYLVQLTVRSRHWSPKRLRS